MSDGNPFMYVPIRTLQVFDQLLPHRIHTAVRQSEIHFLVAPGGSCDSVPFKDAVDDLEPFQGIFGSNPVDDSIWLPSTVERRYGLKVLGTLESPELEEDLRYLFENRRNIAVCPIQEHIDPVQVLQELRRACPDPELWREDMGWYPAPAPILCPESCRTLRCAGGILLVVEAGSHAGKQLEYVMEYLKRQDCKVTAAILWNADEALLRRYYGFRHRA